MLAQLYAPKHAQNQHLQAFYSLTSKPLEVNKMQTDYTGSHSEQHYQHPNSTGGIAFILLFSFALFLAYAVQSHLVTDAFSYCMAQLFQHFSISGGNIIADIVILLAFLLMLFGLFCVFKFFLPIAITVLIIAIAAAVFFAPDTHTKPLTLKDVMIQDERAKESENVGG